MPNSQDQGICGSVVCCGERLGQAVRSVPSLGESWDRGGGKSLRRQGLRPEDMRVCLDMGTQGEGRRSSPEWARLLGGVVTC